MAEVQKTFHDLNVECAKRFLQHAVVVDNGLYFVDVDETLDAEKKKAKEFAPKSPGKRAPKRGQDKDADRNEDERAVDAPDGASAEEGGKNLAAQALIEGFAEQHIICCPYRPNSKAEPAEVVRTSIAVAKSADIVVLDWDLGDGGDKTLEVIKELIRLDEELGGRLRLIAIYTGDKEVGDQYRRVKEALGLAIEKDEPAEYVISGDNYRIVILSKPNPELGTIPGIVALTEKDLAERLVFEFAKITDGLMPNVALTAISEIREATHRILAKYDGTLDPALLTHRVLLHDPHESEEFVVQLIADEIASLLETGAVGKSAFGLQSIGAWLRDRHENHGLRFGIDSVKEDRYSVESALTLLEGGFRKGPEIEDKIVLEKGGNLKFSNSFVEKIGSKTDLISHLFASSNTESKTSHSRVARYSNLAREAFGESFLPAEWHPVLWLGSILKRHAEADAANEYYLCVQPVCDCVRIQEGGQKFPFLRLVEVDNAVDAKKPFDLIIVHGLGEGDLCLKPSYKPMDQALFKFPASDAQGVVKGISKEGETGFFFTDLDENEFLWLGDLKTVFAIRDADRISGQLRRVGMSEFEWLRMRSSYKQ
ncbi:MAG: response regulator receiver domain [Rhodospirillales bacterium]